MKNEPIISKDDVLAIVTQALHSKIGERLSGYSSPLNAIIDGVVQENSEKIQQICRESLAAVTNSKEFAKAIKEEFTHKVAKSLVAKLEGTVEKAVEVLRQNPTLRAEMILKIEKIIKEQ